MRKIDEIQGEEALDVLAEILVPISEIAIDPQVKKEFEKSAAHVVSYALKKYKAQVLTAMAALEGVPAEEYKPNLLELPKMLIEFLSDPYVQDLFMSQSQVSELLHSGSATENTEAAES